MEGGWQRINKNNQQDASEIKFLQLPDLINFINYIIIYTIKNHFYTAERFGYLPAKIF
jgi:hypothetical protein